MSRGLSAAVVLVFVLACTAGAQVCADDLGVSVTGGMMMPGGGDQDLADSGLIMGLEIRKLLTERVSIAVEYRHGVTQGEEPSVASAEDRFSGWGEAENFRTVWNYAGASAVFCLAPKEKMVPFVSAGAGLTFWEVQDWREAAAEQGDVPEGYDTDGTLRKLQGANLTGVVGAGVEYFASERLALTLGARYYYLFGNELDNVGWSTVYGADYVDANSSIIEAYAGLSYYFGPGDCDGDGIFGSDDKCWKIPEDFDGFEDEDGCPDPDNDGDGYLDEEDGCPDEAEDFDGFEDEDGCPDIDRDGDGLLDDVDACPDDPEDLDGFEDEDGCPDPDNDGDGVLDGDDECPGTPAGTEVDERGCAKPKATLLAVMVLFDLNSSTVNDEAIVRLDALANALIEDETYTIEVAGHACDLGSPEHNQALSESRAQAVMAYLLEKGVDEGRMEIVAYGELQPVVPNDSEAQRRQNRRVLITPSRP